MPRLALLVFLLAAPALAGPVETRWVIAVDPPPPTRVLELGAEPPDGCRAIEVEPPARYAVLTLGSDRFFVAVTPRNLWIDRDGDGRFESGEWVTGRARDGVVHFSFALPLPLLPGGGIQPVPLLWELEGDALRFGHALERAGEVELLGRARPFRLQDADFDLRFHNPRRDLVFLDADGDARLARHPGSHERALVLDAIRIGEVGFACRPGDPEASVVEFVRSASVPPARARVLARTPAPISPRRAPGGGEAEARALLESSPAADVVEALGATGAGFDALSALIRDRGLPASLRARAVAALGYGAYAGQADFLERLATTPEPTAVRVAAVRAMYDAGSAGRALVYSQLLRDGEEAEVVGVAARCLAWSRPRMAGAALDRVKEPARKTAIYAAARGGIDPEIVLACARQRFAPLRAMALRDLFLLDHPAARDLALAAVLEPNAPDDVVRAALLTLGGSGSPEAVQIIFDLAALGVRPATQEGRELLALDRRERIVAAIAAHLEAKKPVQRRLAIQLLGQIPTDQAGAALAEHYGKEEDPALDRELQVALLGHAEPRVVRRLQRPIRRARDLDATQKEVERLVARGQRYPAVRAALVELLGWRPWEARVLVLRALRPGRYPDLARACASNLKDRVWQVRLSAAEALARFRVRDGLGALVDALEKEDQARVRTAIAETLGELTGENLRDYPALWRKWWDRQGASFEVPVRPRARTKPNVAAGETKTVATFYGIPVTSNRVIFVLDRSGSMSTGDRTDGSTRLDRAKRELLRAIEELPDKTRANVVFFGTGAFEWRSRLVPLNKSNRRALEGYLPGIDARGGTDMYDALALALEDKDVETIYLLSDGNPSGRFSRHNEMLSEIGKLNRVKRVQIHTIALNYASSLMRDLAEANGGTYEAR